MSNLKLAPEKTTPLEQLLLDASRAEAPSEDHKAKLRAMLGIGLPVSGPASVPPASGVVSGTHGGAAGAGSSVAVGAAAASKSATLGKLALGGIAAAVLVGVFMLRHQPPKQLPPAPAAAAPAALAPAPVAAAPPATGGAETPPVVSPLPPVEESAAVAPHIARTEASSSPAADLSEQIRLIEAARAGVAAHDAKAALAALDSYGARFPRGSFGQEAAVLRIRAVDQAGDAARATALARSFIARFPNSPHVARLKPIAERGASR